MTTEWEIEETKDGIRVRGKMDILVDPKRVPKDVVEVEFVVLTSRYSMDEKVLEDVLEESKAPLLTPFNVRRKLMKKYQVDVIEGIKGVGEDVWVMAKDDQMALFLYTEEGPLVIADAMPEELIEQASDFVYGTKPLKIFRKRDKRD